MIGTPRLSPNKILLFFEKLFFSREYLQAKYCKRSHGLAYVPGYTASNGWFECPECGTDDLHGLEVDYDEYPWWSFT